MNRNRQIKRKRVVEGIMISGVLSALILSLEETGMNGTWSVAAFEEYAEVFTETESESEESAFKLESEENSELEEKSKSEESITEVESETEIETEKSVSEVDSETKNETEESTAEIESETEIKPEESDDFDITDNEEAEILEAESEETDTLEENYEEESEENSGLDESVVELESETETETERSTSEIDGETEIKSEKTDDLDIVDKEETELLEEESKETGTLEESYEEESEENSGLDESVAEVEGEMENEAEPESKIEIEPDKNDNLSEASKWERETEPEIKIEGDPEAWYRDTNDLLWVRENSDIRVWGESFLVDGEAPDADVSLVGNYADGVVYTAGDAVADVVIAPDGKSGLKKAEYVIVRCDTDGSCGEVPESAEWMVCENLQQIHIDEEGLFQIFVRTEDNVGNQCISQSRVICVDQTNPEIVINGISDRTANSGVVQIEVQGNDIHYKNGSMKVSIVGVNGGKVPEIEVKKYSDDAGYVKYSDFPHLREYDDIYHMRVEAEDRAGNKSVRELEFSVNRFGSVYDLSSETKQNLEGYFLAEAKDIVFQETNIDFVGEAQIYGRLDGTLLELEREKDYYVSMKGTEDTWKQYEYVIPASYFTKEGIYEIQLTSKDRADNESDTGIQKKRVAFVLDRTKPDCTVTGISERQICQATSITACLTPHDNMGIDCMRVYRNSEFLMEQKENGTCDETLKLQLEESEEWQTIQIYVRDLAGNEYWGREIPFYINETTEQDAIPVYRKERLSAKEKFCDTVIELPQKSLTKNAVLKSVQGKKMIQKKNENNFLPKTNQIRAGLVMDPGRKRQGFFILISGFLMLTMTGIACRMSARNRETGKSDFS